VGAVSLIVTAVPVVGVALVRRYGLTTSAHEPEIITFDRRTAKLLDGLVAVQERQRGKCVWWLNPGGGIICGMGAKSFQGSTATAKFAFSLINFDLQRHALAPPRSHCRPAWSK